MRNSHLEVAIGGRMDHMHVSGVWDKTGSIIWIKTPLKQ